MTHRNFAISDHHLQHAKILTFKHEGQPLRPFSSVEEMHEVMIERHNAVVRPQDRVYFLGDVAINKLGLSLLPRFVGRKVLIKGNHDIFKLKDYLPYFEDIRACAVHPKSGLVLTHIPIHPDCLWESRAWRKNVHGHLHGNRVRSSTWHDQFNPNGYDSRYVNVSVEQVNYTPVDLESLV